jgi:peptidyl-prolyl cis-trans isomerase C
VKKLVFLTILLLTIFCVQEAKDVLVKVDGSALTKEEFERYISKEEYQKLTNEKIEEFCKNWSEQEILYLEAKKKGIDKEDSIKLVLEQYKKNLLAMDLIRREFNGTAVTETEIREYFDKHKSEFLYAVKLGQIILPGYESARTTLEEIKAGADFYKLARERSLTRLENPEDPKIVTDYLYRGTIADFAIEEIIFSMKPGDISEVIPYLQGTYLIVKMIDKKKAKAKVDYAKYSASIHNYLLSEKYQNFLTQYVDSLKAHYTVTIDLAPLKE